MKNDEVVAEIEIAAPRERVFRALVDPEQLPEWWGAEPSVELKCYDFEARVGGRWRYEGSARIAQPVNGVTEFKAHGEVVEMDPPRLLVYTWFANWHEHPAQPTTVRWELEPTKAGTRVRVTHSGLANEPTARKDYRGGWVGVLNLLKTYVASAP